MNDNCIKDNFSNSDASVLVNCMRCGKQHPTPVKNWLVIQYMTNTNCTFCGLPLAKITISVETKGD